MLELYYTPEKIADYTYNNNLSIKQIEKSINKIYDEDITFIHPKYKNNEKEFRLEVMNYLDYLEDKEEYAKSLEEIESYYNEFNIKTDNLSDFSSLDYFFIKVRLDKIILNRSYKRIKLRTLLKNYGYKRRSEKINSHITESMLFYHIKGYRHDEEINISQSDVNDMITFKVIDFID